MEATAHRPSRLVDTGSQNRYSVAATSVVSAGTAVGRTERLALFNSPTRTTLRSGKLANARSRDVKSLAVPVAVPAGKQLVVPRAAVASATTAP